MNYQPDTKSQMQTDTDKLYPKVMCIQRGVNSNMTKCHLHMTVEVSISCKLEGQTHMTNKSY